MSDGQEYSVDAARDAARRDQLGDWVSRFLESPGSDNPDLADQLSQRPCWWLGPLQLPLDQLHRLAGPPGAPVLRELAEDDWGDDVEDMKERIEQGWEPPPVIVSYRDDQLVLEDGNHRVESIRRAGVGNTWAVIGFEEPDERDRFVAEGLPSPDAPQGEGRSDR